MPGTGNSISVRTAGARDAALLASLGEATFRESWARFNDPADMEAYCLATFTPGLLEADLARLYLAGDLSVAVGNGHGRALSSRRLQPPGQAFQS